MIVGICGRTAAGKDTIVNEIKKEYNSKELRSYATRPMRPGEVDGEKYFFVGMEEFLKKKEAGFFAELVEYNGNYYGISKDEVALASNSSDVYTLIAIPSGLDDVEACMGQEGLFRALVVCDDKVRNERFISRLGKEVTDADYEMLKQRNEIDSELFNGMENVCDLIVDNTTSTKDKPDATRRLAFEIVEAAKEYYEEKER